MPGSLITYVVYEMVDEDRKDVMAQRGSIVVEITWLCSVLLGGYDSFAE